MGGPMDLSTLIRQSREAAGLSQKDLANKAALSPTYLNDLEHGRRTIPPKTALALSRALDMHEDVLFAAAGLLPDDIRTALAAVTEHKKIERCFAAMRKVLHA
jgi:transcriptional regulator with XRE-family HTH domain